MQLAKHEVGVAIVFSRVFSLLAAMNFCFWRILRVCVSYRPTSGMYVESVGFTGWNSTRYT
jgi:hypothetical protein